MKNSKFNIGFDQNGYITHLFINKDTHAMNWCIENGCWGKAYHSFGNICDEKSQNELKFESFSQTDDCATAVYKDKLISLSVKRFFNDNRDLVESYTIKNISEQIICINRDNFGIELTTSDCYTYAKECFVNRCHTHLWCAGTSSYINMLKMGESEHNLGLVLTQGALSCYSQANIQSRDFTMADGTVKYVNFRGSFILKPEGILLNPGEEYTIGWEIFIHGGEKDFYDKLSSYPSYIGIKAEHFTVFGDEKISFCVYSGSMPRVFLNERELPVIAQDDCFKIEYLPECTGEHIFRIVTESGHTHADFLVRPKFSDILRKRIRFIVNKQQCLKEGALDGAYLVFDNSTDTLYYDHLNPDRNACRERLNMSILIACYLQKEYDEALYSSLERFIRFAFREFYDEDTGEVFNTIGKSSEFLRLYNAPGVMLLFSEMYLLTRDEKHLDNILKLARKYYLIGGHRCYANGLCISKLAKAFRLACREDDFKELKVYLHKTVDNIISNGMNYPPHEVNFEQTIVTPAVTHISEMGMLADEREKYVIEAKKHVSVLERFVGHQPSHHLYEMSIRYWDGFWFGKRENMGDTFPHHLSCLTARSYIAYARLAGESKYIKRAEECLRNVSSLVFDNGRGSSAHLFPHTVNGAPGEYYDEWANDQDLVLYDALNASDLIPVFSLE